MERNEDIEPADDVNERAKKEQDLDEQDQK
jgi:hypothetical protein